MGTYVIMQLSDKLSSIVRKIRNDGKVTLEQSTNFSLFVSRFTDSSLIVDCSFITTKYTVHLKTATSFEKPFSIFWRCKVCCSFHTIDVFDFSLSEQMEEVQMVYVEQWDKGIIRLEILGTYGFVKGVFRMLFTVTLGLKNITASKRLYFSSLCSSCMLTHTQKQIEPSLF